MNNIRLTIEDYGINGEGVGKFNGKVCLVPNALITEEVEVEIIKDFSNYCIGKVKNFITTSENRAVPPCPYFNICGGCNLQHMNYNTQLNFKQQLVKKTLKKVALIDVDVNNTERSNSQWNYRNKASFNLKNNKIGFYEKASKRLVEVNSCLLLKETINKIYNLFKSSNLTCETCIKNLVVRFINNSAIIGVVSTKHINLLSFVELLKTLNISFGLYEIINTRNDSVVLSGKVKHVYGIKDIKISNFNIDYGVDLLAFHQTNEDIQNKIYNKILNSISKNDVVINGFSGAGLLSALLSTKAKKVYGIELEKSAHIAANKLKFDNNITNLTNICGDFYQNYNQIKEKCDTLVLNPSKKGCGKNVMHQIKGVKNIIYISCNPIALAKDLREIICDYNIEDITPFDMFPNTINVETFVKLTFKN